MPFSSGALSTLELIFTPFADSVFQSLGGEIMNHIIIQFLIDMEETRKTTLRTIVSEALVRVGSQAPESCFTEQPCRSLNPPAAVSFPRTS